MKYAHTVQISKYENFVNLFILLLVRHVVILKNKVNGNLPVQKKYI